MYRYRRETLNWLLSRIEKEIYEDKRYNWISTVMIFLVWFAVLYVGNMIYAGIAVVLTILYIIGLYINYVELSVLYNMRGYVERVMMRVEEGEDIGEDVKRDLMEILDFITGAVSGEKRKMIVLKWKNWEVESSD